MQHETFGRRDLLKRVAVAGAAGMTGGLAVGPGRALAQGTDVPMAEKVPTRVLGATGEQVPILLMGGEYPFDPRFDRMLHRAYSMGLTYIDTAQSYANGRSHVGVGAFQEQVGRDNLWITSKAGLWGDADASPPERFAKALEEELPVLKTDHVDLFFMHGVRDPRCLDPEWIAMGQDLKKRGLTRFFGFSCHDGTVVELLEKAAKIGSAGIDAIMFRYNFAQYGNTALNKAMDACVEAGIGLMGMKAQGSVPEDQDEVQTFVGERFTLAQAKLKAVWADERISACVSGITNLAILEENANAARSQVQLSMREFQQLNQYAARTAHHRCMGCNTICESRVEGDLRIGDALRYLMYDECYRDPETARCLYRALRPNERSFDHIDLGPAMAACPQGINIAARLAEAKARLA